MNSPNIVLITTDQQHWNTLGCLNPAIKTPNLDRLAAQGTLFTRAYCPNPTCTPTRASMLTGKYASQHGAYALGTKLPEFEPTVNDVFRAHNYRTALIGKAHFQPLMSTPEYPSLESYPVLQDLDFWRQYAGPFYGFEHIEIARNHTDEAHVGQHYAIWMEDKGLTNWRDYFRPPTGHNDRQKHTWSIPEEYHYNAWIAERTNALLDHYQANDERFFVWASFFDPHPDYLVPAPWDTMYDPQTIDVPALVEGEHAHNPPHLQLTQAEHPDFSAWQEPGGNAMHGFHSHRHSRADLAQDIAIYYGMVSCLDKYVGQIVDHLDDLGLAESTLVVFTSDHGHYFGQHGLIAKGAFHYEDGIRVPMIVRMPGTIPAGAQSPALQSLVDYPPTFLSVCGLDIPVDMTGVDQKAVWLGDADAAREHVVVENRHQPTTIHMKTYIDPRYKLTVYLNQEYGELYDLQIDPGELHNLWKSPDHLLRRESLIENLLCAEIRKEEALIADRRHWPNKNPAMYCKSLMDEGYELTCVPDEQRYELFELATDPAKTRNLWDSPHHRTLRATMMRKLLFARMTQEPLWMPRISPA